MSSLKEIVEALLFAATEPLTLSKLSDLINRKTAADQKSIKESLQQLEEEYANSDRAFQIEHIGGTYLLRTKKHLHPYIVELIAPGKSEKLSTAALETLAIIAFKQPVTKIEVEAIRGVDSSGVLSHLQEKELIETHGNLDVPGRPRLYRTTKKFLHYFGISNLDELPKIESFTQLEAHQAQAKAPQESSSTQNQPVQIQNEQDDPQDAQELEAILES